MRRIAVYLAACVAIVSAIGLYAQQADSIASINNPPEVSQSVPRLIMFSGTVKDLTGKPLTGPVELNFAIYKEQADAAPLWQESQTLNVDEQGHYTALLGAMQPEGLPVDLFTSGEARWLGVSAGNPSASSGQGLPEQARVLLVSVPYALKANDAEMLAGKPASAYALAPPAEGTVSGGVLSGGTGTLACAGTARSGCATSELTAPGKPKGAPNPNVAGTGTQNYIPRWTNSAGTLGNSVIFQSGNNIGFGTTTPGYRLDVVGGSARVTNPSGTTQLVVSGSASSGRLGQDAAGFFFSSDTNGGAVRFLTNNGSLHEWMRVTSAGNVGIGTTTAAYKLDVAGNTSAVGSTVVNAVQAGATTTPASSTSLPPAALKGIATTTTAGNYAVGVLGLTSGPDAFGVAGVHTAAAGEAGLGVVGISASTGGIGVLGDALATSGHTRGVLGSSGSVEGEGVYGEVSATTGNTKGVYGVSASTSGTGVSGYATATSGYTAGVYGRIDSTSGSAMHGQAMATSGDTLGVFGETFSSGGASGVTGRANATTGQTSGVYGRSDSSSGVGVMGSANATSGLTAGVVGVVSSSTGTAGVFVNSAGGDILVGQAGSGNVFRVDGTGKGYFNGGTQAGGADFAESVAVHGPRSLYEPGDLLAIDPSGHRRMALARTPYSTRVAGIYSTKPGVLATPRPMDDAGFEEEVPLAIVGIVPCKVTAANGPIQVGDLLVSSSLPGHAMRGTNRRRMLGAVVGKALEPLAAGAGVIQVLVTLQ